MEAINGLEHFHKIHTYFLHYNIKILSFLTYKNIKRLNAKKEQKNSVQYPRGVILYG